MHWHKPELIQEGPWSGTSSLEMRFESRKPPSTGGPSARTKITPAVCAEAPRTQPAAKRASRALFLLHVVCVFLYDRDLCIKRTIKKAIGDQEVGGRARDQLNALYSILADGGPRGTSTAHSPQPRAQSPPCHHRPFVAVAVAAAAVVGWLFTLPICDLLQSADFSCWHCQCKCNLYTANSTQPHCDVRAGG
jgi:hypothetical protein